MASRNHIRPLTRDELAFWERAVLAAELPVLLKGTTKFTPTALAHLASDYAMALLAERALVLKGVTRT